MSSNLAPRDPSLFLRGADEPLIVTALSACLRPNGMPVDLARAKNNEYTATANDQVYGKIKGVLPLKAFFPQGNGEDSDRSGDVVAFHAGDSLSGVTPLRLATTPSKVGETI